MRHLKREDSRRYVALLRGINVGGNNLIKMTDLKLCLEAAGLETVRTYIQSGNVLFSSDITDSSQLEALIEEAIRTRFELTVTTVVVSEAQLQKIVDEVPHGWMSDDTWKYNYIFLKKPYDETEVLSAIGELKPDIEAMAARDGILYQSINFKKFGSSTGGKIARKPVYKIMTIRNHNTVTKLLALMKEEA